MAVRQLDLMPLESDRGTATLHLSIPNIVILCQWEVSCEKKEASKESPVSAKFETSHDPWSQVVPTSGFGSKAELLGTQGVDDSIPKL